MQAANYVVSDWLLEKNADFQEFYNFISGFAALDFTDFARIPMFAIGRKVEIIVSFVIRFLWDHLAAMSYSLFRG